MTDNAAERLLAFYVDKSRDLPWRTPPGGPRPDPYRVWLSEIMLQQTTVATVVPRFARFIQRWPTVEELASARDEDVLSEWAGLGYYARARNLIAAARRVAEMGCFPHSAAELAHLPGVGAYTSAAIAAIAFGEDSAPVDTNVERVLARLDSLTTPSRKDIEEAFRRFAPKGRAGDIAQALMDVGATICRPKNPRCADCPLTDRCMALKSGAPEAFPTPKVRTARPLRFGTAHWIERDEHVWLVRRPPTGLLGGMAALPGGEWTADKPETGTPLARVRHVFTHFALELVIVAESEPRDDGWWHPIESLDGAGLPTLYRRAAEQVLAERSLSERTCPVPA